MSTEPTDPITAVDETAAIDSCCPGIQTGHPCGCDCGHCLCTCGCHTCADIETARENGAG